jgi:hypothetical protein
MGMSEKRTKSDKALRQADQVEKRTEARPEQTPKKPKSGEDFSQAAVGIATDETKKP